ncbi:MAG: penicillin-binding protein 1C, partial [Deltaproteobacteria bacterium]|nr:penicillin-binding protein 1C [Deltaproteobacteria bacterium]
VVAIQVVARCGSYPVEDLAPPRGSTRIHDASGRLLREDVAGGARSRWVPLAQISPIVVAATIATEDAHFRDHGGVRWRSVARATGQLLAHRRVVSGASTITMQVVRLVHPHGRGVTGKLGEMVDALRLERAVDKDAILEQYLNRSPFGANTIGVEAASQRYFGKPSLHLSLAEAALLAGLPQAPSRLDPLVNPGAARARQELVLARMVDAGALDDAARRAALAEPLRFVPAPPPPAAMHFTDWVLAQPDVPPGDVATTLDGELQADVERMVADHVAQHRVAGMTHAAVVVLDNAACTVRAMVGSPGYTDPRAGAVNAALARRQPGSTLKPFTYALAFEGATSPATALPDVETRYGGADGYLYAPRNYTDTYAGPVLAGDALARSLNVPAVRLLRTVGPAALLDRLHALGVASLDRPAAHYGLGLTLGDGEVTLLELAQAYAALARGGLSCVATPFASPHGSRGPRDEIQRVFSPQISWLVGDVLTDETIRASAFGPSNALMLGYPVAVKTGTSSNWRDSWTIGYTPRVTVAVWAGDASGRPMNRLAGVAGAGPLFARVMNRVAGSHPPREREPAPPGIAQVEVCAVSGKRPGPHCAHTRSVHVLDEHVPSEACDWHRDVAIDRRNGLRAGPGCPARFVEHRSLEVLPSLYAAWLASRGGDRAAAYSPLCPASGLIAGTPVVTFPRPGEVFLVEPGYAAETQTVALTAELDPPAAGVTWLVDGRVVGSAAQAPYALPWQLRRGPHRVEAIAAGRTSTAVEFEVR